MDLGLNGKVIVVTGAASGIGAATARALASEGAHVVLADRNEESVQAVARAISVEGAAEATAIAADVTNAEDVQRMVETAVSRAGRLDGAVNNAGIAQPAMPIDQLAEEQFDQLMAVNAKGVWLCLKYEIPAILASGGGAVVNVGSVASHIAAQGQGAYAGSKHAVLGLTRGAALDYAQRGIRVTAVCPALVDTPMAQKFVHESGDPSVLEPVKAAHPIGRAATPEEVADAVLWQLSERASFSTGSAMLVDGGYTAW
ncbi:glucose 1-dehydrogenase [Chelativorans sp.]|uniref:SDR family NAD(P)-dependent oxidoreductase n=1 Tax=Chelativorans sp. TaxID=2203393 RepID=UPI0028123CD1|nr:glucose 1-dehydrogenase [Chelativorans sp.]